MLPVKSPASSLGRLDYCRVACPSTRVAEKAGCKEQGFLILGETHVDAHLILGISLAEVVFAVTERRPDKPKVGVSVKPNKPIPRLETPADLDPYMRPSGSLSRQCYQGVPGRSDS